MCICKVPFMKTETIPRLIVAGAVWKMAINYLAGIHKLQTSIWTGKICIHTSEESWHHHSDYCGCCYHSCRVMVHYNVYMGQRQCRIEIFNIPATKARSITKLTATSVVIEAVVNDSSGLYWAKMQHSNRN